MEQTTIERENLVVKLLRELFSLDYEEVSPLEHAKRVSEALLTYNLADDTERAITFAHIVNENERLKTAILNHLETLSS